jgi:hypothetical protein
MEPTSSVIDLAKMLYQLPLPVMLLAALVYREFRCEKRESAWVVERNALHAEIEQLHSRSEERDAQYTSLVRESVVALTRVADVLR